MKTFLKLVWRRSADEKIPLPSKNGVLDNGAIPKPDVRKEATEKSEKENMSSCKLDGSNISSPEKHLNGKADDFSNPKSEPMSLLRKFAMFVSLDIIALYFVAFAWLIPCIPFQCNFGKEWTVNLDNISISTNLEVGGPLRLGLLLFGHYGGNTGGSEGVTVLTSPTGSVKWQIPLDFRPLHCYCKVIDVNRDGVYDCLIFGNDHLLALNASDGHVFWTQDFRKISLLIAAVTDCDNGENNWIAIFESKSSLTEHTKSTNAKEQVSIVFLDSKNGSVVQHLPLHCDSFPKQLVIWKSKTNVTQLAFQCSYNGRTEVNLLSEEKICSLILDRSVPKKIFSVLFSFGSSTAFDDVFLLSVSHEGLVVGWSTMVAIATDARNPPRLLWQTMSGSIRSTIKFLAEGYFMSNNSMQIAIVLYDGSSSVVKVVNVADGEEVASVDLGSGRVTSILSVSGRKENVDSLLIVTEEGSSGAVPNRDDVIDFFTESTNVVRQAKRYLLLTVEKENIVTELLTAKKRTEVAVAEADCTTLFTATLMSNQTTSISSRALTDNSNNECSCS